MIQPQVKETLKKYTTAAKHVIFDAKRMSQFAQMMDTRDGAVKAVQTVMGVIEQTKPIPPDVKTLLAVNIYVIMVDVLQEVHQQAPDKQMVAQTLLAIIKAVAGQKQAQPTQQAPAPMGLIGGAPQ